MLRKILLIHFFVSTAFISQVSGQGCSDAGFCTMGALRPDQPFNKKIEFKLRSMEVSFYRGKTTLTPVVYVATADLSFSLNDKNGFQLKVPYLSSSGNFGTGQGLSDISLCYTRNIVSTNKYDINLSFGTKVPTNDSNLGVDGRSLPMYYQSSLGTYDMIAGVSLSTRDWLFATGIQVPLVHKNNNQFLQEEWQPPVYPSPEYVAEYDEAYHLKRGTDIMLRVERNFRFSRVNITVGALPIYRIKKDDIQSNPEDENSRVKLEGTTGLALSLLTTIGYSFNVRSGVRLLMGYKLTDRKVNPDGLTRDSVSTVSYYYRF